MSMPTTLTSDEIECLDRFYREGGLRAIVSPRVHYHNPACPHPGCDYCMEWIDFKLELHGDPEGVYQPLVTSWWNGVGFVGRCSSCGGRVRFTTLGMLALNEDEGQAVPQLPWHWADIAQFA